MNDQSHPLTIVAIGILVYLLAAIAHEGIGHAATCASLGGRVLSISSVHCECDYQTISRNRQRAIQAGGTAANLVLGLLFVAALVLFRPSSPGWRYFFWLSAMVNLFQAGGYLMASPFGRFGDWYAFCDEIYGRLGWQIALSVAGLLISIATLQFGLKEFAPFCGSVEPWRTRQIWLLTALPYAAGGLVSCLIALLNPVDKILVATSAGAATFAGTSWILWIGYLTKVHAPTAGKPIAIESNPLLIAFTLIALALWAIALGPGIKFSK
jgi:hypothetical protein